MMWVLTDMTDVIGCCALATLRYANAGGIHEEPGPSRNTATLATNRESLRVEGAGGAATIAPWWVGVGQ